MAATTVIGRAEPTGTSVLYYDRITHILLYKTFYLNQRSHHQKIFIFFYSLHMNSLFRYCVEIFYNIFLHCNDILSLIMCKFCINNLFNRYSSTSNKLISLTCFPIDVPQPCTSHRAPRCCSATITTLTCSNSYAASPKKNSLGQ